MTPFGELLWADWIMWFLYAPVCPHDDGLGTSLRGMGSDVTEKRSDLFNIFSAMSGGSKLDCGFVSQEIRPGSGSRV